MNNIEEKVIDPLKEAEVKVKCLEHAIEMYPEEYMHLRSSSGVLPLAFYLEDFKSSGTIHEYEGKKRVFNMYLQQLLQRMVYGELEEETYFTELEQIRSYAHETKSKLVIKDSLLSIASNHPIVMAEDCVPKYGNNKND